MRACVAAALAVVMGAMAARVWSAGLAVERVGGKVVFHGVLVDEGGKAVGGARYQVYRWEQGVLRSAPDWREADGVVEKLLAE